METCCVCKTIDNLSAPCGHPICKECVKNITHSTLYQDPYLPIKCPVCQNNYPRELLVLVFGGLGAFSSLHNSYEKFDCELCMTEKRLKESTYTFCEHLYCTECLTLYIINSIESVLFDESLTCPECPTVIEDDIIRTLISRDMFRSYKNIQKAKLDSLNQVEPLYRSCAKCSRFTEYQEGDSKFFCRWCKEEFCFRCKNSVHEGFCLIVGLTEDKKFFETSEDVQIDANIVKCPICNGAILLEGGCNAMRCPWAACRNTLFCVLCRQVLDVIKMSGNEQREMMLPSAQFFELAHRETRWNCEKCGLFFKSQENLSNHQGSNERASNSMNENPYNKPAYTHCVCKYCGSKFESSHSLQLHIGRKHNKFKNVFCSICFKWFLHKYALTSHMNYTHLKTKIATCKYCKSEFYNKHIMMKHVKKCKARFPAPRNKSTETMENEDIIRFN